MIKLSILSVLFAFCCVAYAGILHLKALVKKWVGNTQVIPLILQASIGYGNCLTSDSNCAATFSAFPPDPKTHCCGVSSAVSDKLIVGGTSTHVDEYPWVALIEYVRDGKVKTPCGGALISGYYVLTAGHCVHGAVLSSVGKPDKIRLGEYDTSVEGPDCAELPGGTDCTDGAVRIPIEKLIPHPEYKQKEHKHDIALIRMTQSAPYTDFIRPICLPTKDITKETGSINFIKAGWALLEKQQKNTLKQQVAVPFVPLDKCQEAYTAPHQNVTLTETQICAGGEKSTDFCKGDAGLPLMYEHDKVYEVTGIVSFGPVACRGNAPTVYINVYEYNSWIKSNIVA